MKKKEVILSVITVVYNAGFLIEKTIKSIIEQPLFKSNNIQYIIIDGGSSDKTIEIIKNYEKYIDYWISEKDNGIYDAMNKGIDISKGNGLLFLNAGDYFVGDTLTSNIIIPCFLNVKYKNLFNKFVDVKIKNYKNGIPNCHQGIIFENRNIKYKLMYKVVSDYDYFLSHGYTDNLQVIKSDGYIYYDNEGFSKINFELRDRELSEIIYNNFGFKYFIVFKIKSIIKSIIKKMFTK